MRFTVWFGVLLCLALYKVQGQDLVTCVSEGEPAVLSCGVTLTGGLTLRLATWRKMGPPDVVVAQYLIGTSTPGPDYTGRASINDTGFLLLEQVTRNDSGAYRCQATLSDLSLLPVVDVEAVLPPTDPPDIRGVIVNATVETPTSANVQWNEIPVSSACEDVLTYYVDYKLDAPSSPWNDGVGTVPGSADGNETLNFNVTVLSDNTYIFGVRAQNSVGFSDRALSAPVTMPQGKSNSKEFDMNVMIAYEVQGLWSTIMVAIILILDTYEERDIVGYVLIIGPLMEVPVAVAVIAVGFGYGYGDQEGFIAIMSIAVAVLVMSIGASIAGFLHTKKICKPMEFPIVTVALLFAVGLSTSISGMVVSANMQNGIRIFGIVLSAVCIFLLLPVFIWLLCRVCPRRERRELPGPPAGTQPESMEIHAPAPQD